MADMEEREETYLKLFYNRHPGLGAIEPALCHLPGQAGDPDCLLEAERDCGVRTESPRVSSQSSSSLLCLVTIPGSVCIESWDCVLQKTGR